MTYANDFSETPSLEKPATCQSDIIIGQASCYLIESPRYEDIPLDERHSRSKSESDAPFEGRLDCAKTDFGRPV